jgi:hypothetical protein
MSVRRDGVVRRIIESQNVESLSLLSPMIELEAMDKVTFKGIGGINLEESFTDDYRIFHRGMTGLFGMFSPISSQAGIVRVLSYNNSVSSARGAIAPPPEDVSGMDATQLLSTLELLNPFTATKADFPRIGMTVVYC